MNMNQEDNKQDFKILKQIDQHYGERVNNGKTKSPAKKKNQNLNRLSLQQLMELENEDY